MVFTFSKWHIDRRHFPLCFASHHILQLLLGALQRHSEADRPAGPSFRCKNRRIPVSFVNKTATSLYSRNPKNRSFPMRWGSPAESSWYTWSGTHSPGRCTRNSGRPNRRSHSHEMSSSAAVGKHHVPPLFRTSVVPNIKHCINRNTSYPPRNPVSMSQCTVAPTSCISSFRSCNQKILL